MIVFLYTRHQSSVARYCLLKIRSLFTKKNVSVQEEQLCDMQPFYPCASSLASSSSANGSLGYRVHGDPRKWNHTCQAKSYTATIPRCPCFTALCPSCGICYRCHMQLLAEHNLTIRPSPAEFPQFGNTSFAPTTHNLQAPFIGNNDYPTTVINFPTQTPPIVYTWHQNEFTLPPSVKQSDTASNQISEAAQILGYLSQ